MRSFSDPAATFGSQPFELGGTLARIDTSRGREDLFREQRPGLLKALAEHARVASITASNAIEGVTVEDDRAQQIAEGTPRFRNRSEKEFAGYRDAIDTVIRGKGQERLSVPFVLHLHRQLFRHVDGRGGNLKSEPNLIVSYESGAREVIFEPPSPEETPHLLEELFARYLEHKDDQRVHPLVLISALVLDFLAIHPVADGNGRLARLITTHELLSAGYGVARYVSLEQRIFESKNSYYGTLYQSQQRWHEGDHTVWPWTSYLVSVIADGYEDFEERVAAIEAEPQNKQDRTRRYILEQAPAEFPRRAIEAALLDISAATIRKVLSDLNAEGLVEPLGRGREARWRRVEASPEN
jgi:Fic family protein